MENENSRQRARKEEKEREKCKTMNSRLTNYYSYKSDTLRCHKVAKKKGS
jgi:hypothetical protein